MAVFLKTASQLISRLVKEFMFLNVRGKNIKKTSAEFTQDTTIFFFPPSGRTRIEIGTQRLNVIFG